MVVLAILGMVANLAVAFSVSSAVSAIFYSHAFDATWMLAFFAFGFLLKALTGVTSDFLAARAVERVKDELRKKALKKIEMLDTSDLRDLSIADIHTVLTRGLDSLDAYFSKYLPQLVSTAIVVPAYLLIFTFTDLTSALIAVLTLPLIPVFMMLIGWATRKVQNRQFLALQALASHFLELTRGMLTLKVFKREHLQETQILRVSEKYRSETMKVLRVSFLSGFALEMFASLSVALIAVSIGLRLVSGDMVLGIALFLLILAPEVFAPIRAVGANFHASAEGIEASSRVFELLEREAKKVDDSHQQLLLEPGITRFVGASGAGKTRLIGELIGLSYSSRFAWLGDRNQRSGISAWMPQRVQVFEGDVAYNVSLSGKPNLELLAFSLSAAALDDVPVDYILDARGGGLSGGQLQRITLARAVYRFIQENCDYLVLDEPTSAIDSDRVTRICASLVQLVCEGKHLVVASHDDRLTLPWNAEVAVEKL